MGSLATPSTDGTLHFGQDHLTRRAFSRRQFLGGAVRATAIGAAAGSGFLSAPIALADDETGSSVMPRPIPGGFLTPFGVISHHFRPARGIEASTITDFNGFVGLAEIEGSRGVATNTLTGAETPMLFEMDNRFMIGEFVGVDGDVHRGAFGFIWMDLFTVNQDGSQGPQVHDFNPGIPTSGPSAGLFWTAHVPMDSIEVDLGRATASMRLTDFATKDFFTLKNAFLNAMVPPPAGTIPPVDATITLLHRWSGVKARVDVTDFETTGLTMNRRFAGRFMEDSATVEWSATVPSKNFHFKSGPADPSKSGFAEIGRERNGVFFRPGEEG